MLSQRDLKPVFLLHQYSNSVAHARMIDTVIVQRIDFIAHSYGDTRVWFASFAGNLNALSILDAIIMCSVWRC